MWTKLDDALIDHRKVFIAGDIIGKNGPAIAIGLYAIGLMWTNKHLTDGYLPTAVVKRFQHCDAPLTVAAAMVTARLWEEAPNGFQIHDFHAFNQTAEDVKADREWDRRKKQLYADPQLVQAARDRDGGRCRYCGQQVDWKDRRGNAGGQFDLIDTHGPNSLSNVVVACRGCTTKKRTGAAVSLLPARAHG